MTLKRYIIRIDGYSDEEFIAETPSKARWAAYEAFTEAGHRISFKDFLGRASMLHMGRVHGDPRTPEYGVGR